MTGSARRLRRRSRAAETGAHTSRGAPEGQVPQGMLALTRYPGSARSVARVYDELGLGIPMRRCGRRRSPNTAEAERVNGQTRQRSSRPPMLRHPDEDRRGPHGRLRGTGSCASDTAMIGAAIVGGCWQGPPRHIGGDWPARLAGCRQSQGHRTGGSHRRPAGALRKRLGQSEEIRGRAAYRGTKDLRM